MVAAPAAPDTDPVIVAWMIGWDERFEHVDERVF